MSFACGEEQTNRRMFELSAKDLSYLKEAAVATGIAVCVFAAAAHLDLFELFYAGTRDYENWNFDEIIVVFVFLFIYFSALAYRKWRQAAKANHVLRNLNQELEQAAQEIKTLQGIIPICARCKSIRDDQGYWKKVEEYIRDRADVKFTHGLCPECFAILYPEVKMPGRNGEPGLESDLDGG